MNQKLADRLLPVLWSLIHRLSDSRPIELPLLSQEALTEIKRFYPMEKFFVFGYARSGTSLLARLIRTHPEVHCEWTGHFFTHAPTMIDILRDPRFSRKLSDPNFRWNAGEDARTVALRVLIDFFLERMAKMSGKRIVGDKSPNTFVHGQAVEYMHAIYPDGKLIYIMRDGRDAVLSQRLRHFIEFPQRLGRVDRKIRDDYLQDPEPFLRHERSIFSAGEIRRRAEMWDQNVVETVEIGQTLLGEQFTTIRFEDLLENPYQQVSRIWEFLGAHPQDLENEIQEELDHNPVSDWQEGKTKTQMKRPAYGRTGNWRELFTAKDCEAFKAVAGDSLVRFGYEPDLDWSL